MAILTIDQLKSRFERGDFPRQQDFWDLIDTLNEDAVYLSTTAPDDETTYKLWFNTSSNQLSIFYNGSWLSIGGGSDGVDGADGSSAYEVAVANGFSGTQQQWLDSLVGVDGADSIVPGPKGDTGDQGPSGIISVTSPIINTGTSTEANIGIDLSSYYTSSQVDSAIAAVIDAAPGTLNTLNELAAAINDDASYAATMTTALGNKQDKVSGVSDTEIGYLDGVTSSIQTQINSKASTSSPTFTGTVTAESFSGSGSGLTGQANSLTAGSLGGGTNITTYVNMATISANTNTKIATLTGYSDGMYAIYIHWDGGFDTGGVNNYYWSSSFAGITGIVSAGSNNSYYNASPQQQLIISGTQHHRNVNAPTFWMYSDSANASYGNLSLFINVPNATKFTNLQVIVKRLY